MVTFKAQGGGWRCRLPWAEPHLANRKEEESIGFAALCWRVCVLLCLLGDILLTVSAIFVMPSQQRALCLRWCDDVVLVGVLREGLDWIVFPGDHVTPRTPP